MTPLNSKHSTRLLKRMRTGVLAASVFVAAAAAHAQVVVPGVAYPIYNTNFDVDTFTTVANLPAPTTYGSGSLSGSPATADATTQWDTNDPATPLSGYTVGQADYVGPLQGYGSDYQTTGTDQIAFLGGLSGTAYRPGHQTVYDYRTVSTNNVLNAFNVLGQAPILNLSADIDLLKSGPTPSATNGSDTFGFTFQIGTTNLFSIRFVPNGATGPTTTKYNVGLFNAAGTKIGANLAAVSTNSMYHLNIGAISNNGEVTLSLTPESNDYIATGDPVIGATAFDPADINLANLESVTRISPTWIIANGTVAANGGYTNAGSNTMIFDNYAITGVPEPSTWMMLGLGATGLVWRFRRKAQA